MFCDYFIFLKSSTVQERIIFPMIISSAMILSLVFPDTVELNFTEELASCSLSLDAFTILQEEFYFMKKSSRRKQALILFEVL